MDIHDVSGFPRYIEVLEKQKQVLRDAQSRKGQAPTEIKTRDELIIAHTFHHMLILQETPSDAFKIQSSFLPPPYHPSISPLSALKQAMIKDLVLETHHRGDFVLLRTVTPASTMSAIMAIVEDENEDGVILQLYHQDKSRPAEDILEEGAVLIVKEPFLKTTSDGNIAIRVDHLSDVIFLHVFDKKVPRAWRQFPAEEETSADTWRTRGKNFFKRFKHQFAVECFSEALRCSPTEDEIRGITYSRALAFVRGKNFEAAFSDLQHPSIVSAPCGTSLLRRAHALYQLGRYRECCDVYKVICKDFPEKTSAKDKFTQAIRRVAEQERGQFKFNEMQLEAQRVRPPRLDYATYSGPVSIRSAGSRGRGLFTTAAVKAGDLLLCEKAFAYGYFDEKHHGGEMSLLINPVTNVMTVGKQTELIGLMVQKMHANPSLLPVIADLYHGSYDAVDTTLVDGAPVVDTFLAERVMSLNAFGCPLSTRERHIRLVGEARFKRSPGNEEHPSCGIWPKASYTNHSCYSNARRAFIGDMMIVRATQDLEPNTEITMWYRPPLSNDIKGQLADFQHWGFECTCVLCQDIRATDKDTLAKRKQLTARLRKFFKQRHDPDAAKVEAALTDLESTYTRPATEVPRLCFWDPALALSCMYESHKQPLKAIEWGMKSLTALGYVVEGGSIPRSSDAPLVIKKWGLMEDEVVGGWIILSRAYRLVAPELEAAAREYAKICYRICVGEEETFEETYAVPLA